MVKYGSLLDIYDICHENLPYLPNYEHPTNVATPELNSESTLSKEQDTKAVGEEKKSVADQGAEDLGINEFESNFDLISEGDVDIIVARFQVVDWGQGSGPADFQEREKDAGRKKKLKSVEVRANAINLNDLEDSYEDLNNMSLGGWNLMQRDLLEEMKRWTALWSWTLFVL